MEAFPIKPIISIYQFCPVQSDVDKNWYQVERAIGSAARQGADLILLPELWSTGAMDEGLAHLADSTPGLLSAMKDLAGRLGITISGSMPERCWDAPGGKIFNTSFLVFPSGRIVGYRKIHLFAPMGEERIFSQGVQPVVTSFGDGSSQSSIAPAICFDLRFPELIRTLAFQGMEILLVSALWPIVRRQHFDTLLRCRAMENQCFVVAANAWGASGNTYAGGGSGIYGPQGECLLKLADGEVLGFARIDTSTIYEVRKNFLTARPPSDWWPRSENKVVSFEELICVVKRRRRAGQKMAFTNGCFDILHAGHVTYLEAARRLADFLVVGLNSDESVRRLKGSSRPINTDGARARVLAALSSVDYVVIFQEDTPLRLIERLLPDILVKGEDWEEEKIVGAGRVKEAGGRVVRIPFVHDISTTRILKEITKRKDEKDERM